MKNYPKYEVHLPNGNFMFESKEELSKYVHIENNIYKIANEIVEMIIYNFWEDDNFPYFDIQFTNKGIPNKKQCKEAKAFLKEWQFHLDMKKVLE